MITDKLTNRQKDVLKLAIEGLTSKEIGKLLKLSYRTIETHKTHMLHVTDSRNLIHLIGKLYRERYTNI